MKFNIGDRVLIHSMNAAGTIVAIRPYPMNPYEVEIWSGEHYYTREIDLELFNDWEVVDGKYKYVTKDTGEREQFATGSQRDTDKGKPRYDLIPTLALRRVAYLYARGAEKYEENNWAKGQPFSRVTASMERHLHAWKQGESTEDHLAAVVFNALALIYFEETGRTELDDTAIWRGQQEEINDEPEPNRYRFRFRSKWFNEYNSARRARKH